MTLPARLTLLMKLRLMNTPVRIQQPSSRINVPSTPICVRSSAAVSMPKAPPHPVELQRLHLSEKAKPSVSEPRIRMRKSERIEWLNSSGRWRMTRTPTSTTITGIRMPDTPNELSTSRRPSLAPAQPQRFPGSTPSVARSSGESSSPLWSAAQVKNENSTAEAANTPMKSSSNPATQRALSLLERWTFCRPLGDEDVFLDAICVALDFYQAKLRIFFDISEYRDVKSGSEANPALLKCPQGLAFQAEAVGLVGKGAERIFRAVGGVDVQAVTVEQLHDAAGDGGRRVDDRDAAARDDTFEDGKQERIVRAAEHDLVGPVLQHLRDGGTDGSLGLGRSFEVVFDQFDEAPAWRRDKVYAVAVPGRRAAEELAVEAPFGSQHPSRGLLLLASTPTTPLRVARQAGFTAGSMPTIGMGAYFSRRKSMAAAVAVLQATTTSLHPCATRKATASSARRRTSSRGRDP